MATDISPNLYPELMRIINMTYTDRVEQVEGAKIDDQDAIVAICRDGAKRLAIKIADSGISIKMMNPPRGATAAMAAPMTLDTDTIASKLKETGDEQIGSWLDTIKDMLLTSDDLEQAQSSLFSLWPDLATDDLEMSFSQALTLASLDGYFSDEAE
jgi:hypothetical protein